MPNLSPEAAQTAAALSMLTVSNPGQKCPDLWMWQVIYTDDRSTLEEYDDQGLAHGFGDVDLSRSLIVQLIPQRADLCHYLVSVDPAKGQRPIFFRRRTLTVSPGDGAEVAPRTTVHCLGWQKTVAGQNVASYTFIFEDGSSLVTDDFQAV